MSFIDVPNVPGVPNLSSYAVPDISLLAGDAIAALLSFFPGLPQWGVFLGIIPVLTYDNVMSFSYHEDWKVSTYPVEQGSFQSYDKVQIPSEIRLRLSAGGSVQNRIALLTTIDLQMSQTLTYNILTPEKAYLNYNFMHRDYDKAAESAGMIVIDLWFIQILQTATALFQNTLNPANASAQGAGAVGTSSISAPPSGIS